MHVFEGFFSRDPQRVIAAVRALADAGVSQGAVERASAMRRGGAGRGRFERGGLFCERLFGPSERLRCRCGMLQGQAHAERRCPKCAVLCSASVRPSDHWAHVDVEGLVHPVVLREASMELLALEHVHEDVLRGRLWVHLDRDEFVPDARMSFRGDGWLTGPDAFAACVARESPEHPMLPLCRLTRVPVPPPTQRPLVWEGSPEQVEPWLGWTNLAWSGLVRAARQERQLVTLEAPEVFRRQAAARTQSAFLDVFDRSEATLPPMPPLVSVPAELEPEDATRIGFVRPGVVVVQTPRAVVIYSDDGEVLGRAAPPGWAMTRIVDDRYVIFDAPIRGLEPFEDPSAWGGVSTVDDGLIAVRDPLSILDVEALEYLEVGPRDMRSRRHFEMTEPEELRFVDAAGRRRPLDVGGDRPEVIAWTRDHRFAWVGEIGAGTEVIDIERGVTQVYPYEPSAEEATALSVGASAVDRDESFGTAVTFADGRWYFLWYDGLVSDHTGREALQVAGALAGAFDPWASSARLAVVVDEHVVFVDVLGQRVERSFRGVDCDPRPR